MFSLLSLMLAGVLIGYLLRNFSFIKMTEKTISITVLILLFIFGLTIGSNSNLIHHIGDFGWQALILAIAGLSGSLIASSVAYKMFFKKGDKNEK